MPDVWQAPQCSTMPFFHMSSSDQQVELHRKEDHSEFFLECVAFPYTELPKVFSRLNIEIERCMDPEEDKKHHHRASFWLVPREPQFYPLNFEVINELDQVSQLWVTAEQKGEL